MGKYLLFPQCARWGRSLDWLKNSEYFNKQELFHVNHLHELEVLKKTIMTLEKGSEEGKDGKMNPSTSKAFGALAGSAQSAREKPNLMVAGNVPIAIYSKTTLPGGKRW